MSEWIILTPQDRRTRFGGRAPLAEQIPVAPNGPMHPVEDLCHPLAESMWSVHGDLDDGPRLIFPFKRTDIVRVSEQESKVLLCQVLERSPWFYSVETPTRETYMQSGISALSARVDVTVYGSRSAADRILNVELKAGVPPTESFRKDFEKLVREAVNGLWFHTLERTTPKTFPRLLARMREAVGLLGGGPMAAGHTLTLAVCLLDRKVLLSATITLGADLEDQLEALFGAASSGWSIFGPGADDHEDTAVPARADAPAPRVLRTSRRPLDRTVQEKLLIYCPQITDDTLLHFSQIGDSYRLRAYSGQLAGNAAWVQPDATTASSFLQAYCPVQTIDVRVEGINVEKTEAWAAVVTAHNRRLGIGS